jgi:hypothetical protein
MKTQLPCRFLCLLLAVGFAFSACSEKNTKIAWHYNCYCSASGPRDSCLLGFRIFTTSGDELPAIGHGLLLDYDPKRVFFGYDTKVIVLHGSWVIPRQVGTSAIFVLHPNPDSTRVVDTVHMVVTQLGAALKVSEDTSVVVAG